MNASHVDLSEFIRPGDGVLWGQACSEPLTLTEAFVAQRARYTGKIVEKNRTRVAQILSARAMGFPIRQVCEGLHVSPHTVAEIERRHSVKLATLKERLARKFGVFVELGIDRAIAEVGKMDIDKLFISDVQIDKAGVMRRFLPRAHGRATPFRKQLAHVHVLLSERT